MLDNKRDEREVGLIENGNYSFFNKKQLKWDVN